MGERICLAPGARGTELTKSLALHGVNCFNLRVVGAGELARIALMRSGIAIPEEFIGYREEAAIISEAMKGVGYFERKIRITYSDIEDVALAIRRLRSFVSGDDEAGQIEENLMKGIFLDKNTALVQVYKNYMKLLEERKLIDTLSIIRRAVTQCDAMDSDFFILEEYQLAPIEKSLLERLSGGKYSVSSIFDLYGVESAGVKPNAVRGCYGAPNEVEMILADIYSGRKAADKCTVAVTDPSTYGQLFFDYAVLYNIPVSFGFGIPVTNSNPARLLVMYYRWMTKGFFGGEALNNMLHCDAFDGKVLREQYPETDEGFKMNTFYKVLGKARFTNDAENNKKHMSELKKVLKEEDEIKCIPLLEVAARELSLPMEDFISKYSRIRKGSETVSDRLVMSLDMAARETICNELKIMKAADGGRSDEDLITDILSMNTLTGKSEEGRLYVTTIDSAISSVRDTLYVAGLSASRYPGSPRENYLVLDNDIEQFGNDAMFMTSKEIITGKLKRLLTLIRLYSAFGAEVNVSYSRLNVAELKAENASSVIYELYREENGNSPSAADLESYIKKVAYFEPAISVTREIGSNYNLENTINRKALTASSESLTLKDNLDREYSPTALDEFFGCPKRFYLGRILGIRPKDEEDPFSVIGADESGTLAHLAMEALANSDMSKEDFLALAGNLFDDFLIKHPPLVAQKAADEKADFIDLMATAYDMDPHLEVVLKEEDIHHEHESGVKVFGFPDRVEKLEDGSLRIVDFKSGRDLKHVEDDINTCLQVVLYAYLMEKEGYRVSGAEYRYIRLNRTVTCKYDDEMKKALDEKLRLFKESLEKAEFPITPTEKDGATDPCKYCKFGPVCGKM